MTRLLSPAVYRRMIAFELQRMRKAADVTQQEAAAKLGCSRVRINHEAVRRTELRLPRQRVLDREGTPLELTTVIDESVLRRRIGDTRIMREQLEHLSDVSERTNVAARILGADVGVHPALHGPFTLMDFAIPGDPGVVYLEDRLGGRYYEDADEIDEYIGLTCSPP
ncbi:DUF5753 domain-containing protein [Actinopolyspora alba]|uniref:DUF5753 domain-containing protein n=1 Tax=Actinopolyspora alba TaxID=673379 RepID=UPI000B80D5EF|nr:DUF5753 domain-containing protein [Actinopolyspora alba]